MRRRLALFVGLLLAVGSTLAAQAQDKIKESEYYPLKAGTKWEYKVGDRKLTAQVAKHEKVGDVMCALVEVLAEGKVVATEHIAVQEDGIYRYTLQGDKYDPPLRILKLPPAKGDTWTFETKLKKENVKGNFAVAEVDVTVPLGKYKAYESKSTFKSGDQDITITFWFAKDVGMVKQVLKSGSTEFVVELEKFEPAK
jgi:hypothetical protein